MDVKAMELQEVYENLCVYDIRNPYHNYIVIEDDDFEGRPENCSCDNCFYGCDKLAREILRLLGIIDKRP